MVNPSDAISTAFTTATIYSGGTTTSTGGTISGSGTISDTQIEKAITAGTGTVTINTSSGQSGVSGNAIDKLAAANSALVVKSDVGSVKLSGDGVKALADKTDADDALSVKVAKSDAATSNFTVLSDKDVIAAVDVSILSDTTKITTGFGTLTISIPVGKALAGQTLVVLHLREDGTYERISAKVDADGNIAFDVTSLSSFAVMKEADVPAEYNFDDVIANQWYVKAVQYAYDKGMMTGTAEHKFSPDGTTTRAMIVTILWRLEGKPAATAGAFTDLTQDWYTDAVNWAAANGIVTGFDATSFKPDQAITREQFAAIMFRYAGFKKYDVTASGALEAFTDAGSVSSYALAAMKWANAEGLITGRTTTTLVPTGSATRAEAATILMRLLETVAK
jgi:hypothetical protein